MIRRFEVGSPERFALMYEMFAVGAQLAASKERRTMANVRDEIRIMDALDAISQPMAQPDGPRVVPIRALDGPSGVTLSQPEHELLSRYLELAVPVWHIKSARDVVAVVDLVAAAERVE